ncbi:orotidine 5'-phosphate decarboxylase / HUMPS family protein [Devosia sp.]|uniref:orotidine 5'-phosphate decarboxylase / HUMPS family protein n=1 Tax=Devosia sp. TaxID=1871048 RepID=UPI001AD44F32|nr:orotidine 5'-phosphate decarboxylase / HUMPS family protein [Devosia sp.]MBN9309335.1 orotidine 5'-phosphate decarboxylase [Devosia sp.]
MTVSHPASARVLELLRTQFTFQISVDVDNIPQGLMVARAALNAGITLVEIGTPLCKYEGVRNVVPVFRQRFPEALLLADMKTMDGGGFEARTVYEGGGNIIDFLAAAGVPSAKAVCAVRDEFRERDPELPRLAFADILLPLQGPAAVAVDVAERVVEAGIDGVGLHLQLDARRADPELWASSYLADTAQAVFERVGKVASVQVVGGLSIEQAEGLAKAGLRAFVISGNMGVADSGSRYGLPPAEITELVRTFIAKVSAAG